MTGTIARTEIVTVLATGEVVVADALPACNHDQAHLPDESAPIVSSSRTSSTAHSAGSTQAA
jgi:hypothetical protein